MKKMFLLLFFYSLMHTLYAQQDAMFQKGALFQPDSLLFIGQSQVAVKILTVNQWGGDAVGAGIVIENLTTRTREFHQVFYMETRLRKGHYYYIYATSIEGSGVQSYTHRIFRGRVLRPQEIVISVDQASY